MFTLTPEQLQAVQMLANGKTHAEIASELGITTKTVQRWTKKPEFNQALVDVQSRTVEKTIERTSEDIAQQSQEVIRRLVPRVLKVLNEYLNDPSAKGSDRLRACHIIGSWAGLHQAPPKPETEAETQLKDYLTYLSTKNGNTNGSKSPSVSSPVIQGCSILACGLNSQKF